MLEGLWQLKEMDKEDRDEKETYLRDDVQVGDQSTLQNDWDVACVEEFDRVRAGLTTEASRLEALEVDDDSKDQDGSEQVGQVWQVLTRESLL